MSDTQKDHGRSSDNSWISHDVPTEKLRIHVPRRYTIYLLRNQDSSSPDITGEFSISTLKADKKYTAAIEFCSEMVPISDYKGKKKVVYV